MQKLWIGSVIDFQDSSMIVDFLIFLKELFSHASISSTNYFISIGIQKMNLKIYFGTKNFLYNP